MRRRYLHAELGTGTHAPVSDVANSVRVVGHRGAFDLLAFGVLDRLTGAAPHFAQRLKDWSNTYAYVPKEILSRVPPY